MKTLELSEYGVMEMNGFEMMNTDGEYSWNQFCNDAGYAVGAAVGYATNAADIAGTAVQHFVEHLVIHKAVH